MAAVSHKNVLLATLMFSYNSARLCIGNTVLISVHSHIPQRHLASIACRAAECPICVDQCAQQEMLDCHIIASLPALVLIMVVDNHYRSLKAS